MKPTRLCPTSESRFEDFNKIPEIADNNQIEETLILDLMSSSGKKVHFKVFGGVSQQI